MSIANGDGSRRETSKSKLMDVINPKGNENSTQEPRENHSNFVINFIALAQILTVITKTFENLILKIIKVLPVGCTTLHVVTDSYREVTIKSAERKNRITTPKVYVKSVSSNVSREIQEFSKNDDNKSRLIELFFDYVIQKGCKVLNITRASKILSKLGLCMRVTFSTATEMTDLSSNHEEADTKVILHCANALSASKDSALILCSPSGDTDINVLATALLENYNSRLFI